MHIRAIPAKKRVETRGQHGKEAAATKPRHYIQAFEEHSPGTKKNGRLKKQPLNAHDLFNLFTADIIKDNTIFRR